MMEHSGNENVSPAFSAAFQSMEDFDRECQKREEAERAKNGMLKKAKGPPPAKKQKKKAIDEDALAREKAALEEIGDTNWVGKLNGDFPFPLSSFSCQLTKPQSTEVLIP
jgi:hypothetical protein